MRLSTVATLVAGVSSAQAFRDTSPFLLFSSSSTPSSVTPFSTNQLQSAADVLKSTKEFVASCPSDLYILISQPSLSASDLTSQTTVPMLRKAISDTSVQTSVHISEVVGLESGVSNQVWEVIRENCAKNGDVQMHTLAGSNNPGGHDIFSKGKKVVILSKFEPLTGSSRERDLANNDAGIYAEFLEPLSKDRSYTVIYTTSPANEVVDEDRVYTPDFQEVVHMDLKRDIYERKANGTRDPRPLFEKYNFLSAGLFMAIFASLILLSILAVGIKALGSLEVSYGAFDKEMGPAAQKKAQ